MTRKPENFPFEDKIVSGQQALNVIKDGDRIVTAMAASEPQYFLSHLAPYAKEKTGIEVYCANPSMEYDCFKEDDDLEGRLQMNVMFLTSKVRHYQGQGRIHYVPQHLSQWARNLKTSGDTDVFWGSCSSPDGRGYVSLGLSGCYESEIFRTAKLKILEINPNLPITFGATNVSIRDVDYFIRHETKLPTITPASPTDIDFKIGEEICNLVPDGATIQLGIGGIPNAVGHLLKDKKDLGIHTEMINDAMMNLHKEGVVTNSRKTIWPGKIVGSFVYGSEKLYRYVDRNPVFELQPSSVVNDPYRIGRNHNMISINTAVEVDITGQVCSESIGHIELSGVGGASETHIGAQRSPGGRGIIALRSTSKKGASKIVFELKKGAKVSISRNDIDTIITEYGAASLRGCSVSERARKLIEIAHPQFREELLVNAKEYNYI